MKRLGRSRGAPPSHGAAGGRVEHVVADVRHVRCGRVRHAFSHRVDYVLVDPERPQVHPLLFSRNRVNLLAVHDRDHGGPGGHARGAAWARDLLARRGLSCIATGRLLLLAQPRLLGRVFNPVAFWLAHDAAGGLRCVVAEVTNTFGDRRAYVFHRTDLAPITPRDRLLARKRLHVSPFQPAEGEYRLAIAVSAARIRIRIELDAVGAGLVATLSGPRRPLTVGGSLRALLHRPFGAARTLALIHWQALGLWRKGVPYRRRPRPPADPD